VGEEKYVYKHWHQMETWWNRSCSSVADYDDDNVSDWKVILNKDNQQCGWRLGWEDAVSENDSAGATKAITGNCQNLNFCDWIETDIKNQSRNEIYKTLCCCVKKLFGSEIGAYPSGVHYCFAFLSLGSRAQQYKTFYGRN